MKLQKNAYKRRFLIFVLFVLSVPVYSFAQNFQTIRDGMEHAKITRQMKSADGKDESVVFNLLRLDLRKVRLNVVHAMDAAIGTETTSSIATRHGAIAAINAGFFRLDKSIFAGDAAGALIIDKAILSESYANRTSLFIANEKTETKIDIGAFYFQPDVYINKKLMKTSVNRERKLDDLVVYTPEFNRTTLTDNNGIEIVVKNDKIFQIYKNKGSNIIPEGGLVISASGKMRDEILKIAKIKAKTALIAETTAKTKIAFEDVVGGVPQLIKDGKIEITWEKEKSSKTFVETHHPRTAVAKLKDGKFLMVTVDGRSEESGGISLPDLAAFLLESGATDAMNLDGGGSTTMFLDGKIVNKPSDKEGERAVSDAILVFPRK